MSDITVSESSRVAVQARQDAAELRNQENTNQAAGRSSGAGADNPAVNLSTSSLAEKAGALNIRLDEMARTADASPRESAAREPQLSSENAAVESAKADAAATNAANEEAAVRALAEQTSAQMVQEKLSMTTPADRNILQYLTG